MLIILYLRIFTRSLGFTATTENVIGGDQKNIKETKIGALQQD